MRIVIITSSAKSLFDRRKEMLASWVSNGHEVIALGEGSEEIYGPKCAAAGYSYRKISLARNGVNPFADYKTYRQIKKILSELQPDRVFCSLAKAVSYGCWAARSAGIKQTYALVSGLGSIFRGNSIKSKLICVVLKRLYKNAFKGCRAVILHNADDLSGLVRMKLLEEKNAEIINGSGVDLIRFYESPLPGKSTFLFIGRLLKEKGIREFLNAAIKVKEVHPEARFIVVGDTDTNPSSLSNHEIESYKKRNTAEFIGFKEDVRPYIEQSDIFVLPSYHEGRPRSVLEAMSMGRPIITTTAPGCRDTVNENVNGFKVPVANIDTLAEKMIELIENPGLAQKMGKESRKIAEDIYDVDKVNSRIAEIMEL